MTSANSPIHYCCSQPDRHPRFEVSNGRLVPVLAGSSLECEVTRQDLVNRGWVMDDSGVNISNYNPIFGDLTVLYWAWKNSKHDHISICQYRRRWDEGEVSRAEDDTLYIPTAHYFPEGGMKRQYEEWHGPAFPAVAISRDLANRRKIPLTVEMVDYAWEKGGFYGCNMVRGSRYLFNQFCELVFSTIMPFYNENIDLCNSIAGYNRRSIAFAAERMISALLVHRRYFFGNQAIKEAQIHLIS